MKKHLKLLMIIATFFTLVVALPASGQAPPPPTHGQNGNQTSPNGTGCPLDRTQGIMLALVFSLGYGGLALYYKNKKEVVKE